MNLPQGTLLKHGEYRIERGLGQGGFGITYLAVQVGLNRRVTIKEFFMSDYCNRDAETSHVTAPSEGSKVLVAKFRNKFIKEAQSIASMKHPNIINIYDVFEENGTAYYVMEYLDHGSLADVVKRQGRLSEVDALSYIRQIADALSYIHARKMSHLDVKPDNILINEYNAAVLIDFGISKHYDNEDKQTSTTPVGISHGYAPLEQYKKGGVGTFSPATDIYSLGATLYKLITGTTPPDANDINDDGLPPLPSYVSVFTAKAIKQAMQPRRKDRPQSIEELLALLNEPAPPAPEVAKEDEETLVIEVEEKNCEAKRTEKQQPTNRLWLLLACVGGIVAFFFSPLLACVAMVIAFFGIRKRQTKNASVAPTPEAAKGEDKETLAIKIEEKDCEVKRSGEGPKKQQPKKGLWPLVAFIATVLAVVLWTKSETTGKNNGHECVDLGLSVKWATCNLGASSPSDQGNYYAWGETSTKSEYTRDSYKYLGDDIGNNISGTQYDAARANWGGTWRMPTLEEIEELIDKCTWTWTTLDGHNGYLVTGPNGKSIFLPAAGIRYTGLDYEGFYGVYWSATSTCDSGGHLVYNLSFSSAFYDQDYGLYEYHGFSIRPGTY